MSIVTRPLRIMIGDGTALPTTFAGIQDGDLAIVQRNMTLLAAGQTISDSDEIFIVHGTSTAGPQFSAPIIGSNVRKFEGESFSPGTKQTTSIGFDRITAQTVNVFNDTEYSFDIVIKDEKDLYSHRQLRKVYFYTSSAAATAKEILENLASQLQKDINNSGELLPLKVVVVGDGTGNTTTATIQGVTVTYHDVTAATNFGLEITGTEYSFSQLKGYQKVFFEVGLRTGFDSTVVVSNTQAVALGQGTYEQIYMIEDFGLFYYGFTNRRLHPLANPTRYANATPVAVALASGATVTTAAADDEITFSAAPGVIAGSVLNIATLPETVEIKFFKSATVAVITVAASATVVTQAVTRNEFYDVYTIEHDDNSSSGNINGQSVNAPVRTIVAIPSNSTQGSGFEAIINPWMGSLPKAFSAVIL